MIAFEIAGNQWQSKIIKIWLLKYRYILLWAYYMKLAIYDGHL